MNWSLLGQQLAGYLVASLLTFLATRYHLTQEQQGIISADLYAGIGIAGATVYGLWTNHRAFLSAPPKPEAKNADVH